jgi:hypothetical protein
MTKTQIKSELIFVNDTLIQSQKDLKVVEKKKSVEL